MFVLYYAYRIKRRPIMAFFKNIEKVKFEGKDSTNPMSFKYYDPERVVAGKKMKDHLRFAMSYWHTLTGDGSDPFGTSTMDRPWNELTGMEI